MQVSDHGFETNIPLKIPYRLFLPDGYDTSIGDTVYPLIVCLHGAGARGADLAQVDEHGLPSKLLHSDSVPFVVVAPQCPRNLDWSMILPALHNLVTHIVESLRVDPDRIYLTGFSMGGFGAWAFATEYPNHFAAVVPICGGGRHLLDFPNRLKNLVHIPVWCFHGDQDQEIPLEESLKLVRALQNYGGNVRCTIYPGTGHDSWTQTYDNPELYKWLLEQKRRNSGS